MLNSRMVSRAKSNRSAERQFIFLCGGIERTHFATVQDPPSSQWRYKRRDWLQQISSFMSFLQQKSAVAESPVLFVICTHTSVSSPYPASTSNDWDKVRLYSLSNLFHILFRLERLGIWLT